MDDTILVDRLAEGVARITLNRPAQLNGFEWGMYPRLIAILEGFRFDAETRVIILTGAGKGFCAGHDLGSGGSPPWVTGGLGRIQRGRQMMTLLATIPPLMRDLPQPIIAAVNGAAAGIGYVLALAADIALAGKSAKFVNAIHNTGTGAELGLSYLLPRAVGSQRAAELLLTARPVLAEEAERIGLVLRMVEDDVLIEEALKIAEAIKVNVPIGVALTKQSLWLNQNAGSLSAAIEMESRAVLASQATDDMKEKVAATRERRAPRFDNL